MLFIVLNHAVRVNKAIVMNNLCRRRRRHRQAAVKESADHESNVERM